MSYTYRNQQPFPGYDTITYQNVTGGFVGTQDFIPSIIFAVLYVAAGALLCYRLVRPANRTILLIVPGIFLLLRLVSLVMRLVMSLSGVYGIHTLVAEVVLISIGYLLLIWAWLDCSATYIANGHRSPSERQLGRFSYIVRALLAAALILSIVGSAMISSHVNDPNPNHYMVPVILQRTSAIVAIVVLIIGILAVFGCFLKYDLDSRILTYLQGPAAALLVVSIGRICQTFSTSEYASARSAIFFWIMEITFEYLALMCLLCVNLPNLLIRSGDATGIGAHHEYGNDKRRPVSRTSERTDETASQARFNRLASDAA